MNQLLVELDGIESIQGVILLASTNRSDVLDKALLRSGRFDRHITIELPTLEERKEMFALYLKSLKTSEDPDAYIDRLAQLSPGMSGLYCFGRFHCVMRDVVLFSCVFVCM